MDLILADGAVIGLDHARRHKASTICHHRCGSDRFPQPRRLDLFRIDRIEDLIRRLDKPIPQVPPNSFNLRRRDCAPSPSGIYDQQMDSMTMRGPDAQKLDAEGVSLYPPHDGLVNLHGPRVVSQRE